MSRIAIVLVVLAGSCAPGTGAAPSAVPRAIAPDADAGPRVAETIVKPDETFREHAPEDRPAAPLEPPSVSKAQLSNGIPVYIVRHTSQLCAIQVVAAGGLADVRPDGVEVINLMGTLMHVGTAQHSSAWLRDTYASMYMEEPQSGIYPDAFTISATAPSEKLTSAIDLVAEVALSSNFPAKEFLRTAEIHVHALERDHNDRARLTDRALRRLVFGKHPYARLFGSVKQARAVSRAQVAALHARLFDERRLTIVVATDTPAEGVVAKLEAAFGNLKAAVHSAPESPAVSPPTARRIMVIDRPGESLAYIGQALPRPPIAAPDASAALLAFTILADNAVGRLQQRLRDELAEVPWLTPRIVRAKQGGMFGWVTQVPVQQVASVLGEIERVVRTSGSLPPSADELTIAQRRLDSWVLADYETVANTARAYATWLAMGVSPEDPATQVARYDSTSLESVGTAAKRYLATDQLQTVVVGDWKALREPLASLGWGPVEAVDVDFVAIPSEGGHGVRR
ncbi:MAG TPA: insulinase family protein [Polyangiaceae bacterium]|nr:insulinase family protein [Polyangiaceae bacterium]